jgi:hypothetical protein
MKSAYIYAAGLLVFLVLTGCKGAESRDSVLSTVSNPSHTRRASVIQRQFVIDGRVENSPVTYVLLGDDSGAPNYPSGVDFPASDVVMKPSHCGPLSLTWNGDDNLTVVCMRCGLSLAAAGQHASQLGGTRIEYEGFPDSSSWETAPRNSPSSSSQ